MVELAPQLITPDGAALPDDGGVLVGWESRTRGPRVAGDPSYRPEWKTSSPAALDKLAPGLTLYRPNPPGALTITDGNRTIGRFQRDTKTKPVALAAPEIARAELVAARLRYGEIGNRLDLTFAKPVPDGVVAVIVYVTRGKTQPALSFGRVTPGATKAVAFTDMYRCMFNPDGTQAPKPTETTMFAWVDQFGRRSKLSAARKLAIVDDTKRL